MVNTTPLNWRTTSASALSTRRALWASVGDLIKIECKGTVFFWHVQVFELKKLALRRKFLFCYLDLAKGPKCLIERVGEEMNCVWVVLKISVLWRRWVRALREEEDVRGKVGQIFIVKNLCIPNIFCTFAGDFKKVLTANDTAFRHTNPCVLSTSVVRIVFWIVLRSALKNEAKG